MADSGRKDAASLSQGKPLHKQKIHAVPVKRPEEQG